MGHKEVWLWAPALHSWKQEPEITWKVELREPWDSGLMGKRAELTPGRR